MRDSVPSVIYSSVCIILRQWSISLIPTYRVYRLYDIESRDSYRILGLGGETQHLGGSGDMFSQENAK